MFAVLLLVAVLTAASPVGGDTVLVRDQAPGDGESVLGWRRVPAGTVQPEDEVVPDVYLDLLGGPDEPFFRDQWAMQAIGAPWAWQESAGGAEVVIAVVDSGIDVHHPDLSGRVFTNQNEVAGNGIDDDHNGAVDDIHGWDVLDDDEDPTDPQVAHGTQVASVLLASLNGSGMAGVAPGATLLPVRVCTTRCDLIDVARGIVYATDTGADVINLSLGGFAQAGPLGDALDYAQDAGVLIVAAAGNDGTNIDGADFVPAGLPNTNLIAVAATDRADRLWSGSNWGRATIDIGAPGVEIVVAALSPPQGHTVGSGTSFASPHVAGAAAMMLAVDPDLAPDEVIALIGRYSHGSPSLATTTVFGGRVQADAAVSAVGWRDVRESPFDDGIIFLDIAGITAGCNPPVNDLFCPLRVLSRGEMAALLTRALHLDPGPDVFADDTGSIFQSDINALAAAGITTGCNPPANDRFCPQRPLTRGEMAALLTRALHLDPGPDVFTDDTGSIFQSDINALAAAGITTGCNPPANDQFCPERPLTRGEMAALLHGALG